MQIYDWNPEVGEVKDLILARGVRRGRGDFFSLCGLSVLCVRLSKTLE